FKRAFKVHPYQWTPIGSAQYIDQATISEFKAFHDKFYVPDNATLSIAGDINIEQAKALIAKYFSDIPRGKSKIERTKIAEPPQTAEIRDVVYDNIQLPAVIQAYHMPAQGTKDYYALQMLTNLLSKGGSSRLVNSIVDKQQKAMYVGSFPFALEDAGLFIIFGIANMNVSAEDLEKALDTELDKAKAETLSDDDLQKLKNQAETEFVDQNTTMAGIAENLANYHVYFGDANLINTEIDRYMKVSKEDIKRVANDYLKKDNRVVLYYLSKKDKKEGK
ncbi:MAG: pitrilysin family protein, partial [Bacteroidota bacterium]